LRSVVVGIAIVVVACIEVYCNILLLCRVAVLVGGGGDVVCCLLQFCGLVCLVCYKYNSVVWCRCSSVLDVAEQVQGDSR